jgi:CheY-like chemotaxis protein
VKKVLIAEDNADFALSLRLALEVAGYVVEVVANGSDAIARQRTFRSHILITDIVMPEKDGLETLNAFRQEFPATRIVVVSGDGKLDPNRYLETAALIGADATFRKPFQVEALLEKLKSL